MSKENILFIGLDGLSYRSRQKYKKYITFDVNDNYKYDKEKMIQCSYPPSSEPNWSSILRGVPASELFFYEDRTQWKKAKELDKISYNPNLFSLFQSKGYYTQCMTNWEEFYDDVCNTRYIDNPIIFEDVDTIDEIYQDEINKNKNKSIFTFILIKDIDHIAHAYSENSKEYVDVLKQVNSVVDNIINNNKIDCIIISCDHGRDLPNGKDHFLCEKSTMSIPLWIFSNTKISDQTIRSNYHIYHWFHQYITE